MCTARDEFQTLFLLSQGTRWVLYLLSTPIIQGQSRAGLLFYDHLSRLTEAGIQRPILSYNSHLSLGFVLFALLSLEPVCLWASPKSRQQLGHCERRERKNNEWVQVCLCVCMCACVRACVCVSEWGSESVKVTLPLPIACLLNADDFALFILRIISVIMHSTSSHVLERHTFIIINYKGAKATSLSRRHWTWDWTLWSATDSADHTHPMSLQHVSQLFQECLDPLLLILQQVGHHAHVCHHHGCKHDHTPINRCCPCVQHYLLGLTSVPQGCGSRVNSQVKMMEW